MGFSYLESWWITEVDGLGDLSYLSHPEALLKPVRLLSINIVAVGQPDEGRCLFSFIYSPLFLKGEEPARVSNCTGSGTYFISTPNLHVWGSRYLKPSFPSQFVKSCPLSPVLGPAQVPLLLDSLYTFQSTGLTPLEILQLSLPAALPLPWN